MPGNSPGCSGTGYPGRRGFTPLLSAVGFPAWQLPRAAAGAPGRGAAPGEGTWHSLHRPKTISLPRPMSCHIFLELNVFTNACYLGKNFLLFKDS